MAIKGAIIGDIIGSQYEFKRPENFDNKTAVLLSEKCEFTDDTVLTLATKYAILNHKSFAEVYAQFGEKYRHKGFGGMFLDWLNSENKQPYGSCGNGSAMRISYLADCYGNKYDLLVKKVRESAECTHNHSEGIKGAIVTAVCIAMAKQGKSKEDILQYGIEQYPESRYAYSPEICLEWMSKHYIWNALCQGSVPVVIRCIYEANNYTEFIRNVLSLKCDTDTLCAIGGGIAEELFDNSADPIMTRADDILNKYLDDYLLDILKK